MEKFFLGIAPTIDQCREAFLVVATAGKSGLTQAQITETFQATSIEDLPNMLTGEAFDEYQRGLQKIMDRDRAK